MHALLISAVTLSQFFWSRAWGFERRKFRSAVGTGVWGLVFGSAVAVGCVIGVVLVKGRDGGRDPEGWAWIDVVSGAFFLVAVRVVEKLAKSIIDFCRWVCQAGSDGCEIHAAGVDEL